MTDTTTEFKDTLAEIFEEVLTKLFGDQLQVDNTTPMASEQAQLNKVREGDELQSYSFHDDPIPVKIVANDVQITKERPAIGWTGSKIPVFASGVSPQGAQLVAGFNKRRTSVILNNKGANLVAIGPSNNVKCTPGNNNANPEIAPGESLTLDVCTEIWAIAETATPATGCMLHIFQIFEEGTPS
jgi:hypothetical protein